MQAEIIAVGDELLCGMITNTNASYLSARLLELGVATKRQVTVGDAKEEIKEAVAEALRRADIVITSGGLGPTGDDLTKEAVAEVLGLELEFNERVWEKIKGFFWKRNRVPSENNRKQAYIPSGAEAIENEVGTAPGVLLRTERNLVIMLPGPPQELRSVFSAVIPDIAQFVRKTSIVQSVLKVVGIGESSLEVKIGDLLYGRNPHAALYAKPGEVHIVIRAEAQTRIEALESVRTIKEELKRRLGEHIYGEDEETLESVVARELMSRKWRLVTVESCTGGLLTHRLTNVPGSSNFLERGIIAYSNRAKEELAGVPGEIIRCFGAVSRECALAMAEGARTLYGSDAAVSITGIAGPGGATETKPVGLVYIAVSHRGGSLVRKFIFQGDRKTVKWRASQEALVMLREAALGDN